MGAADGTEPIETASADQLRSLQLVRLKETVSRAYNKVPHYRRAFDAAGAHPDNLKQLSDISKFPFTTKQHLRDNYPFGMLAVPMDDIIRIHASSGTTGKPTVVAYTRGDIQIWSQLMARSIRAAGVRPGVLSERASRFVASFNASPYRSGIAAYGSLREPGR